MDLIRLSTLVDDSPFTKLEIAEQLGISRQGLDNKLNGKTEFKSSEIKTLSRLFNLTSAERDSIFFNDYVDEYANREA